MPGAQRAGRATRIAVVLVSAGIALSRGATPAAAAPVVFVDALGVCAGNAPCFTTIQAGVNNATAPMGSAAQVRVFPGTYVENVDVSLMGSAVAAGPGDLLLINEEFFQLLGLPANAAATSTAAPPWLPTELAEKLESERARFPFASATSDADAPAALAALQPVLVAPIAGPAIFNSIAHPAEVTIFGIDVLSVTSDGVRLTGSGIFAYLFGTASGNLGHGVSLVSSDEVSIGGCVLNDNGGSGAMLRSSGDEVRVATCVAERNDLHGFEALGAVDVSFTRLPFALPFVNVPTQLIARGNMGSGIMAQSENGNLEIADFATLISLDFLPGVILDDNGEDGAVAIASGGISVAGAQANGNGGSGFDLTSGDDLLLLFVTANGNEADGITGSSETASGFVLTANGNVNGINLTTSATRDLIPPFPDLATVLLATTTNDNALAGLFLTATGGPIGAYGPVAVGNDVTGVRLVPPLGSQNVVTGGIFCSSAFGAVLATNAQVNAEGNWWGSASGPFHATKNPGGMGVAVADGSSGGGAGDVDFAPWIDTVTASAPNGAVLGLASPVRFQFSGGGGTVFLGVPPTVLPIAGPGAQPPFTVQTDNGVVATATGTGPSATTFLTAPNGIAEVTLIPFQLGPATVTLTGPCGLTSTLALRVRAAEAAPSLSATALLLSLALLGAVAAGALRRLRPAHGTRR